MTPLVSSISEHVDRIVRRTPVHDIHTHLYDPAFGDLLLWGIDDLLVYHYLVAEAFRYMDMPYERFWALEKSAQAELVWDALFARHSPISESCQGVVTTLRELGLDPRKKDLPALRKWFADWKPADYVNRCMELAGVETICMTNSPFDPQERPVWERGFARDGRFLAALRIDPLLLDWGRTEGMLRAWGYGVSGDFSGQTFSEIRRFLGDWTRRLEAKYLMVSLPPEFDFPDGSETARILTEAVLPECRDLGLPFAMMPGVRRGVNPGLQMAGDGLGWIRMQALSNLCAGFPNNKFAVTVLPREHQHELCVLARKFRNLHIFGCWWFTNIPCVIEEMTRMRVELLGLSFTAQHSDARVLDQIIYKWRHSRRIIGRVLAEKYAGLAQAGWIATEDEIQRDVAELFGGGFRRFCAG